MTSLSGARLPALARQPDLWARAAWRYPEWWSLVLSACAWVALIARTDGGNGVGPSSGHAAHAVTLAAWPWSGAWPWIAGAGGWMIMVVAMMLPLTLDAIRTAAARSLWRRRHRAIAAFLAGYLLPWGLAGLAISALGVFVLPSEWRQLPLAAAATLAVAAAWQLTPAKRRALVACHRTVPLAPEGWRATRDCILYGWMIGGRCVASCWALMLVCVVAGHSVTVMAAIGLIGFAERSTPLANQSVTSGALAGGALIVLALALALT